MEALGFGDPRDRQTEKGGSVDTPTLLSCCQMVTCSSGVLAPFPSTKGLERLCLEWGGEGGEAGGFPESPKLELDGGDEKAPQPGGRRPSPAFRRKAPQAAAGQKLKPAQPARGASLTSLPRSREAGKQENEDSREEERSPQPGHLSTQCPSPLAARAFYPSGAA